MDLLVVEVNDLVAVTELALGCLCSSNFICVHLVTHFINLGRIRIHKLPVLIRAEHIELLVLDGQKSPRAALNIRLDIHNASRRLPDVPFVAPD